MKAIIAPVLFAEFLVNLSVQTDLTVQYFGWFFYIKKTEEKLLRILFYILFFK